MPFPLPSTVHDPDAQENFDALARVIPITGANIANKAVADKQLAKPVIAGTVKANGEKESGEGFSSEKTSTGNYKITLSTELATNGAIVVSLISGGGEATQGFPSGPAKKVFTVGLVNNAPASKDGSFHFMIKAT